MHSWWISGKLSPLEVPSLRRRLLPVSLNVIPYLVDQMITIRSETTAETLVALNQSVHNWHVLNFPDLFEGNAVESLLGYFRASLVKDDCFHFVALDEATPIGFIQAEIRSHHGSPFRHPQELLYIIIVVVAPDYRSKGVGRRLMEEVFSLARSRRIGRVELDHWEGNDAALAFDKLGFRPYRHYMAIELHTDKPQT